MNYQPTLKSVRSHPLPGWYDDAKLGIFIHWGPYSVPAFAPPGDPIHILDGKTGFGDFPYAEWYLNSIRIPGTAAWRHHHQVYGAGASYEQFAPIFDQQLAAWNPQEMADVFVRAGARYVVLVTKHHDGFLMWPSKHPNPRRSGYQVTRDVTGELTAAVNARGLQMGLYYSSLLDWTFTSRPIRDFADLLAGSNISPAYHAYVRAHWHELIERYHPMILWSDIGYPPREKLPRLFAEYYNQFPLGLVNDRWWQIPSIFFNSFGRWLVRRVIRMMDLTKPPAIPHCDFDTAEYTSSTNIRRRKWEACRGVGSSFAYNQFEDPSACLKAVDAIRLLVDVVSKNGNLLLNVGPRPDGSIPGYQVAVLEGLGDWLRVNGEAIYGAQPWIRPQDSCGVDGEVHYTVKPGSLYAVVTRLPAARQLLLPADVLGGESRLLETGEVLAVERSGDRIQISLPAWLPENAIPVVGMAKPV